jgi:hypothetical protein
MRKYSFTFFLLLGLSAVAGFASAQIAPRVTVQRENAGTLNADGWIVAESTEGKFAVDLPSPFKDFSVSDPESSPVLKTYFVGSTTSDNVRFFAMRVKYRTSSYASLVVARLETGEGVPGKVVSLEKLQHLGYRAVSIMMWKPDVFLAQQTHLVGEDTVTLMIEGPIGKIDLAKPIADHFFNSLRIQ